MSKILGNLGHRVTMAEDGEKAVACVGADPYDLVLMDMQMPVMDGLAATQAIRALGGAAGRVPIIGVTANAFREDEQRCLAAGMDAYISKPVTPAMLAQVIGRLPSVGGELSSTGQEPSAGS